MFFKRIFNRTLFSKVSLKNTYDIKRVCPTQSLFPPNKHPIISSPLTNYDSCPKNPPYAFPHMSSRLMSSYKCLPV